MRKNGITGCKESEENIYHPIWKESGRGIKKCNVFAVEEGEYVAIMGESGSGKTTLLNILAALDKPTQGKIYLKGK